MRILLLEVAEPRQSLSWTPWVDEQGRFAMPSVGLVSLASLARPQDQITIIDEKVAGPLGDTGADLVGISFKSMYAKRAYRVADSLRARGIKVVVGGVHASIRPDEAARHADIVVVGEAEHVWKKVLDDVEAGRHELIYRAPYPPQPLDALPPQRVDLLQHDRYMIHAIQSARGCSFTCEFCPTRTMFGDGYRLRNVQSVVDEVTKLLKLDDKPVFFTENVFGAGDYQFITDLTRQLRSLSVRYAVFCDWLLMRPELAQLLADNGCGMVMLNLTGRNSPAENAAIEAVHRAGLPIWGYFMFGFEEDTPDVFEGVIAKVRDFGIVCATLTVLSPYPGTPMGTRVECDGRVLDRDSDLYDQAHVVFTPRLISPQALQQGFDFARAELADVIRFDSALKKVFG